jgi:spoIIIJ-associated protein
MDKKTNLDAYLENLGISDEAAATLPPLPARGVAAPNTGGSLPGHAPSSAATSITTSTAPNAAASSSTGPSRRLVASSDAIIEDFLQGLLVHLGPNYSVSARQRGDNIFAEISGGDSGRIIGRDGRTLAAIEYLASTVMAKETQNPELRVNVDAAGYRRRHEERLVELARRTASRVRRAGESVSLGYMSAADRRIIHITLKEHPFVMTESSGEGRERHLVVKPRQ